ncbi:metallophosphoesterase family protein [uncultured Bacteroides sp.]|uniref:metallophosphoesterase family protein n=1 Tax=uncultured Bacteroides sp. TaxID=162156 RepID=UPI002636BE71|nr:metallophosphoesterase family protein [uncultured Bacteroides sp.]
MYKKLVLCLAVLFSTLTGAAQKEVLKFGRDGKFKIVQFTDVHYKYDDQVNSQISLDRINEVLDAEHPDFVIFTGDVVVSNETFKGLDIVLEPCIKRHIPFGVVFGNHDDEYDSARPELYDYIAKKKGCLMPVRTGDVAPDYVLTVRSSKDKSKNAALLYCIDSHSYTKIKSVPGYDWIKFDQIAWYRSNSLEFTQHNEGVPLPALAFFHIPIPEYDDAVMEGKNRLFGVRGEGVACPTTNSGLFTAIKECGDVMGMFVGHDHNNDYAVAYKEVLLAYGRYSGGNTVYSNLANGARVIILQEGERKFDSYIRLAGGEIESRISYPGSFY